jgi:hypothetical protein
MIETTKRIVCEPSASAGIYANTAVGNPSPALPRSSALLPAGAPCCGAKGPEALESEDPAVLAEAEGWDCAGEDCCPDCAKTGDPARA